jgi:predicted Zn-dependent peptidase
MYFEEKLDSGIPVVCEQVSDFHSVTVGIWVRAGSVTETEGDNGISHLIEHMLFKGTEKRTSKQIAMEIDNMGGQINAFTAKECTCYYIKMIDEKLDDGLEVLSDLFLNSVFDEKELEKEKGVVLEEIAMYNDTPDEVAHELISSTFFKGTPLEKSILGPAENIRSFLREDIIRYKNKYYGSSNIVIAVAGNFDRDKLMGLLNRYFGQGCTPDVPASDLKVDNLNMNRKNAFVKRDIEQAHLCLAFPGCAYDDRKRFALSVLNNLTGSSMSSRLFQKIREEMGMAYAVYSYPAFYSTTGMFGIYAGTTQKNTQIVLELIVQEMQRLKKDNITREEFIQGREQLKGNYILALESTSAKMNAIGKGKLLTGKLMTEEETITMVDKITYNDVFDLVDTMVDFDACSITVVGKEDADFGKLQF